ncbi:MAG: rhomboid family intramembrane serine protease [Bryobacteraceae bacterium]
MIPLRDSQPSRTTPYVTIAIILVNVVLFLYGELLDPYSHNAFTAHYSVIPARLQVADLFTSMFLHGGWLHLIGNMWFLWIYGDNIEDILGKVQYVVFYLACGVAAALTQVLLDPGSRIPILGASGAIAGVMGAYVVKFPHSRITTLVALFIFWTTIEVPAYIILVYWFVIQLFSGAATITSHSQGGVAWFAHVGGFLTGILLIYVMKTNDPWRHRRDSRW